MVHWEYLNNKNIETKSKQQWSIYVLRDKHDFVEDLEKNNMVETRRTTHPRKKEYKTVLN